MRGEKGRTGKERGKGLESRLEQWCCLSPWVIQQTQQSVIILLQTGCSAPVRTPDAAPSLELPCAQRSGFQGFPVTIGRMISWTAFLRKGGVKNGLGAELTLIYRSAPNPVSILATQAMKRRRETVLQQRARFLFILGTTACHFASFRKGVAGPQRLHTLPVEEMKPRSQELAKTCGRAGQWAELCGFRFCCL